VSETETSCGTCSSTECSAKNQKPNEALEDFLERQAVAERMCQIKHKILVMSGKGGVGKSTVAANLARTLSRQGKRVGLMDVDIHGPSIPHIFGLQPGAMQGAKEGILPVECESGLKVMSIGLLIEDTDAAIIWRGPMKMGVIKQFIKDVEWGELDYLIIDSPPGTGDEPLSVCQLIEDLNGAIIVTTPQQLAISDVRRSITFCHQLNTPVLGVIENMSGFVCPKCGEITDIFKRGGGEQMATNMLVPYLGRIPLDPIIAQQGDRDNDGTNLDTDSSIANLFDDIAEKMNEQL